MDIIVLTPVRLLGDGLSACFSERPDMRVLAVVGDASGLRDALASGPADVVLIDVTQGVDPFEMRAIAGEWPQVPLLALGLNEQRQEVIRCGRAGFSGYVARDASIDALCQALGDGAVVHRWKPNDADNPYLAFLSLADAIVITGDSESMLAEATALGRPVYVFPLPERPSFRLLRALREPVVARAQALPTSHRGTPRPQQGVEYLCARLIERGFVRPTRDLDLLHQELYRRGVAKPFGAPFEPAARATRKYWPGCRVTPGSEKGALAPKVPVPVAEAYCSDQPVRFTVVLPRLNSSMKSWV